MTDAGSVLVRVAGSTPAVQALSLNRTLVLPTMLCSCVYAQWPFIGAGNLNCQPMHMQGLFPRLYT